MGQHVGHVSRKEAERLSPALTRVGGVAEAQGLIVGGWSNDESQGSFGIRVWLTSSEAARLDVMPEVRMPRPEVAAPTDVERRLTPSLDGDAQYSSLTVTCEERYQSTIAGTRPDGWNKDYWPIVVAFIHAEANPHTKIAKPCMEVRLFGTDDTLGFLTPAMSARHAGAINTALAASKWPTALANVGPGTRGGATIWRVTAVMPK